MTNSVSVRFPAGNRWHAQIRIIPGEFNKETIYRVLGKPQGLVQHPGLIKTQLLPVLGPREEGKEQLLEPKMRESCREGCHERS